MKCTNWSRKTWPVLQNPSFCKAPRAWWNKGHRSLQVGALQPKRSNVFVQCPCPPNRHVCSTRIKQNDTKFSCFLMVFIKLLSRLNYLVLTFTCDILAAWNVLTMWCSLPVWANRMSAKSVVKVLDTGPSKILVRNGKKWFTIYENIVKITKSKHAHISVIIISINIICHP